MLMLLKFSNMKNTCKHLRKRQLFKKLHAIEKLITKLQFQN